MADVSDDFTGADLSAWNPINTSGAWTLDTVNDNVDAATAATTGDTCALVYDTSLASVNHWAYCVMTIMPADNNYGGPCVRQNNSATGYYGIYALDGTNQVFLSYCNGTTSAHDYKTVNFSVTDEDAIGLSVEGTGSGGAGVGTVIKIWKNPANASNGPGAGGWGDTPDDSYEITAGDVSSGWVADTGTYAGLTIYIAASRVTTYDTFYAGALASGPNVNYDYRLVIT